MSGVDLLSFAYLYMHTQTDQPTDRFGPYSRTHFYVHNEEMFETQNKHLCRC